MIYLGIYFAVGLLYSLRGSSKIAAKCGIIATAFGVTAAAIVWPVALWRDGYNCIGPWFDKDWEKHL
jgi:hypothetical protein